MLDAVVGADHGLDVVQRTAELDAGIERAVGVEDLLDLLQQGVEFRAVHLLEVGRAQPAVAGLGADRAAQADHQLVVFVHQPEGLLPVADLAQVELRLKV